MGPARIGESDVLAVNPLTLTWLPGSQELAFRVYASINALGNTTEPEIRLVDTATGAQRVLLAEGVGAFTFSPDGQRMTLADDDGIDLLDVGGGSRIADVVAYPTIGFEAGVWYPMPVWADDGRKFSMAIPSANLGDGKETLTVWEVAATDGAARELATYNGFPLPFAGNVGSAIFSPDQAEIAFYHTPERSNEGVLVVANVRGEWQTVYDAGWGPRFLGWAPDGSRFAYVVGQGQRGLLRIGRLCERPSVFDGPAPAGDTPVRWIDGERFLYQTQYGSAGPTTLLLGALDGTVREIGQLSERQDSYAFSEIGQYESEAFGFQFAIPSGYVVVEYDHPDALQYVALYKRVLLANVRGPLPEIFVTVHQNEDGLSVGDWFAAHTAETMTDTYPVFVNPRNVRAERFAGRAALSFEDMTWSHGFVTLVEAEGAILEDRYTSFAYPGLADAFEHVRQSLTLWRNSSNDNTIVTLASTHHPAPCAADGSRQSWLRVCRFPCGSKGAVLSTCSRSYGLGSAAGWR